MKKQKTMDTIPEQVPPYEIVRGKSLLNVKESDKPITHEKTIWMFLQTSPKKVKFVSSDE